MYLIADTVKSFSICGKNYSINQRIMQMIILRRKKLLPMFTKALP